MAGSWFGCLGGEVLSCWGRGWTTKRSCRERGSSVEAPWDSQCGSWAGPTPLSLAAISVLPPESFQSVCRQTCLNTMTCVFFHLLPPPLCSPHPVGSAASPPGHLPAQFAELLLSRSLMTPCGQVQWAFLGPRLPCPLSGV